LAIFGLGAYYDGTTDMSDDFISNGLACIGWKERHGPAFHNVMRHIKVGDIVYLKSHPPTIGLIIKAVGIVTDDRVSTKKNLGRSCIKVRWIWNGNQVIGKIDDKYNVRNVTLYEEYSPVVQKRVLKLLFSGLH